MAWVLLGFAGILEVVWATAMKLSQGFSRPVPTVVMLVAMAGSFWLLAMAMRSLPLGSAYMVWTGIGAFGSFILGIWLFGEALTLQRALAAALLLGGMVLMKLS